MSEQPKSESEFAIRCPHCGKPILFYVKGVTLKGAGEE